MIRYPGKFLLHSGKPEAWTFARLEQMRQQYNEVPCLVVDQLLFFEACFHTISVIGMIIASIFASLCLIFRQVTIVLRMSLDWGIVNVSFFSHRANGSKNPCHPRSLPVWMTGSKIVCVKRTKLSRTVGRCRSRGHQPICLVINERTTVIGYCFGRLWNGFWIYFHDIYIG